ncbi:iron-sulfur cluster biosynthesis family protein [Bacillus sp. B15-48]|uniref:iron-sulfur cluster biosynthesis family protein n=1 Tax=Bacillus sp. B15-48 TaxID=1548601 RepID=UPI0031B88982|nr:iron-sulfur cluster biosynthesis family protein [Bacillus sp. B15-48]
MYITITENAEKKLIERTAGKNGVFKIKYDTENCCAVNGIAVLWFVEGPDEMDEVTETNSLTVYIEKTKKIFFDEEMTIDYVENRGCFQLKSRNQYFNPCMTLIDKTV